jgi:diguanylate cyclase (GGDEF)-like protein
VLLNERLETAIGRIDRDEKVAVHHLDLDQFKAVNDTLGHPAGDKLLKIVADRLRGLVRQTDTIARMGGDEFVIVQSPIIDPADATSLAQRVIRLMSEPYDIDGQQAVIGASIGIAVGPGDGSNADKLLRNADLALYRAKGDGRGTFRFFEPAMDLQMQTRRIMEQDLRKALPAGEFELYYQPVVNLASNDISGFEALIRWNHPERGIISPAKFIPLAEEIGFIVPIGEWVIRQACATAARWPGHLSVAVNISAVQFRNPGLMQVIVGALAASGLDPTRLEIEITETVLLHNREATLAVLHQLRALGIRIAMDDFGTGYSSLTYLQCFPFDKIKIDRSFVKDITENSGSLNIVRAIAALANGMGMTATAEGVETREQLDQITSEGCTEMQGFLFSQPIPAHEVERLFLSGHEARKGLGRIVAA